MSECTKCWGTGKVLSQLQLGEEARRHRVQHGWSLRERARCLGITDCYLSLLERGKRTWNQDLYRRALS